MAFNQFMHPRNIYRQKPNYAELAKFYPEFAACVINDSNAKAMIDYSNPHALRSLTKTLLKQDFDLDVEIPEDRLIPTLPMRINYILWIEDLLQSAGFTSSSPINGLDIGTGCCAIFPLLGTTLNKNWSFVATDIDSVNLQFATLNVNKNNLSDKIIVYENTSGTMFKSLFSSLRIEKINFIMTNPPFFSDTLDDSFEDNSKNKTIRNFHHKKMNTSCLNEAIVEGGEISFIKKIIEESFEMKNDIDIFSAMIGRKKSYLELKYLLKDYLNQNLISDLRYTELCQGNTKRWAIAWTFQPSIDLKNAPQIKCIKPKPLIYYIPSHLTCCQYDLKSIGMYIQNLIENDLEMHSFSVIETKRSFEFDVKSNINTWSNQRKKRRQQNCMELSEQEQMNQNTEVQINANKRFLDDDHSNSSQSPEKRYKDSFNLCRAELTFLLHFGLKIKRDKQQLYLKMVTKQMSQNKESTHQVFQYLKNKLN